MKNTHLKDLSKKWRHKRYAKYQFSEKQIEWLVFYEKETGFEPMVDETGDDNFYQIYRHNIDWYEIHTCQCHKKIGQFNHEFFEDLAEE